MGVIQICKCKLSLRKAKQLAAWILPAFGFMLLTGCASLSEADAYFISTTPDIYPARDAKLPVPLLAKDPDHKFKVIGTMDWETPRNWQFVRKALERTANKNGAEAVILREKEDFRETTLTDVPPSMRWVPVTRIVYVSCGSKYNRTTRAVPVTDYYPVFRPGFVAESIQHWTGIRADFIVSADAKPVGRIPEANIPALNE